MLKVIIFVLTCTILLQPSIIEAKMHKHKKKSSKRVSRFYKKNKKGKKHHRARVHHGSGPDLKDITSDSSYKENPNNGVNSFENK